MKAQISLEYLVVLAISFVLLIPGLYIMLDYAKDSSSQILNHQIYQIGTALTDASQTVDGYGRDARLVIEMEFPDGIANMTILNNTYLVLESGRYQMGSQLFRSKVNITGTFIPDDYSVGKKRYSVESRGDYISITRI